MDSYRLPYRVQIQVLCVLLCFCYSSCKDVKAPEQSFNTEFLQAHEVEFLNSTLWLPPNYEKLTYDALFEIAKVTDDNVVNMLLQSAKEYRDQEKKPVFFRDELVLITL